MNAKKVLIGIMGSLFVGFFLLSPGGVMALSQLATNTPTFIPPSVTPTDINFTCPIGTPAGWGTYTPSALWQLECSSCASVATPTMTAAPTFTPNPTYVYMTQAACQTAPAGGEACYTPTLSPPTATITMTPTAATGTLNMYAANLGVSGSPYIGGQTGSYTSNPVLNTPGQLYVITGTVSANDGNNVIGGNVRYDFWFDPLITSGIQTIYVSWQITNVIGGSGASAYSPTGTTATTGSTTFSNQYNTNRQISIGASSSGARNSGTFGATFTLWVSTYPYDPTATATPTITPTPYFDTGYCSSVAPTVDGFGFDLFVPDGEPNCNMGWNEFGVGEEYTVPAVQICFQPSQFGVIRMFNEDYEVGVYGLAAAAAFLWRYFRTV